MQIIDGFKFEALKGTPYIWGAIDGSHIRMWQNPTIDQVPSDSHNYQFYHSILLQPVVTITKRFLDICANMPSSTYDTTHLCGKN